MRAYLVLAMLLAALTLFGCSDGSSDAPASNEAHPDGWIGLHGAEANDSQNHAACALCHGSDLRGRGDAISCFGCHSYNTAPPFTVHPPDWTDPYMNHRLYAVTNGFGSCVPCHGQNLRGGEAAPSCLASSFNGVGCHADGPGGVPHPIDGIYLNGLIHGFDAKADLTACQACHGQVSGPGSNPRFNIGIAKAGGVGCEGCHNDNTAHPSRGGRDGQQWYDGTYRHGDAQGFETQCTLCHGVNLEGGAGPACTACHAANPATFPTGCISCHGTPPNGNPTVGNVRPNRAGSHAVDDHERLDCSTCHNGAGFGTAEHFDETAPADVSFSLPAPDNMTIDASGSNPTCTGICHGENHRSFHWY